MLSSLSSTQRDTLTVCTLLAPVAGLVYLATASDGAVARAGWRGLVMGLSGSVVGGVVGFFTADHEDEELPAVLTCSAIGGLAAAATGVIGSFAYEAMASVSD
ncbi:MAG TPA: hypothetical protein VFJ84_01055 [Candidatus Saccharimonadales bacterium]|nr:hypothetical protein [Candidatus Saccharimonadales bacterium]